MVRVRLPFCRRFFFIHIRHFYFGEKLSPEFRRNNDGDQVFLSIYVLTSPIMKVARKLNLNVKSFVSSVTIGLSAACPVATCDPLLLVVVRFKMNCLICVQGTRSCPRPGTVAPPRARRTRYVPPRMTKNSFPSLLKIKPDAMPKTDPVANWCGSRRGCVRVVVVVVEDESSVLPSQCNVRGRIN